MIRHTINEQAPRCYEYRSLMVAAWFLSRARKQAVVYSIHENAL